MDPYLFKTEEEAQKVLDTMKQIAERRTVKVSDLRDLVGDPSKTYLDETKGWARVHLEHVKVQEFKIAPYGYCLNFPDPIVLDV
jgi:hypothetical protein